MSKDMGTRNKREIKRERKRERDDTESHRFHTKEKNTEDNTHFTFMPKKKLQ